MLQAQVASDFVWRCQEEKMRTKWLWKSAHRIRLLSWLVWIESATEVTPVWAARKMSFNGVGNWWVWSARINAICSLRKNRGAALPQVTENVNAGHEHTVSARTVRRQLHREGYYNRAAVHKPLITKMNAHLEFSGAKKPQGSTEMWKKVMQSNESSFALFSSSGREWREWCTVREWYKPDCSTRTVRGSAGSVVLSGTCYWHGLGTLSHLQGRVSTKMFWTITFLLLRNISVLMEVLSIHGAQGASGWFDEDENDVNHMSWPSQPHRASSLRWHSGFLVLLVLFSPKKQMSSLKNSKKVRIADAWSDIAVLFLNIIINAAPGPSSPSVFVKIYKSTQTVFEANQIFWCLMLSQQNTPNTNVSLLRR